MTVDTASSKTAKLGKACAAMFFVLAVSAWFRLPHLASLPEGIHGDEGWTGMRAAYITQHGWIGFFDPIHSVGQWALPEYVAAAFIHPEDPVYSIRLPSAIVGILSCILVALLVFLITESPLMLLCSGLMVSLSVDHIILSRVALPPIYGLLWYPGALYFAFLAYQREKLLPLLGCGFLLSLGAVSYGGAAAFIPATVIALGMTVPGRIQKKCKAVLVLSIGIALPLVPVIVCEINNSSLLIRAKSALLSTGPHLSLDVVVGRLKSYTGYFFTGLPDTADGTGIYPWLPWFALIAFVLAIIHAYLYRRTTRTPIRTPIQDFHLFLLISFVCGVAFAAFMSLGIGFGFNRRMFPAIIPFTAFIFLSLKFTRTTKIDRCLRTCIGAMIVLTLGIELSRILALTYREPTIKFTYVTELTKATEWALKVAPADAPSTIILSSGRWKIAYETSRYLIQASGKQISGKDYDGTEFQELMDMGKAANEPVMYLLMPEFMRRWQERLGELPCKVVIKDEDFWGCLVEKATS